MTGASGPRVVIQRIPYDPIGWEATIAGHPEAEVYHSPAWLSYLQATQHAEPVVAVVRLDGTPRGFFVGAIVRRFGIRILGSPLRGWTTPNMGFLLDGTVERADAAAALLPFAFKDLGCLHVELADLQLTAGQVVGSAFRVETSTTYRVDLEPSEDDVFGAMRRTTRQEIRKACRAGLRVEVASDDAFAPEFHAYLTAVFARQGLAPTYSLARVRELIRAVQPSGQLLLLRVRSPAGATLGTSISVGRGRRAVAWGMAFDRENTEYHAIELLWWETIRRWKAAGALSIDLGGAGEYKAKYGAVETSVSRFYGSRFPVLRHGRTAIRRGFRLRQALTGRIAARSRAARRTG